MLLSVNYSESLLHLLRENSVKIDAIEWSSILPLKLIQDTRSKFPELAFTFHPGRMDFSRSGIQKLNTYLSHCSQTPFVSIHLAPLPKLITWPALHKNIFLPEPRAKSCVNRFIAQILTLKQQTHLPVVLENMPSLHPARYLFETDPQIITRILNQSDCLLLLDLAHARIAASIRGLSTEEYLTALPLEKVIQIHMSGVKTKRDGYLFDAHEKLGPTDLRLLEWTLQRTQPQWLTLEYFRENSSALLEQLTLLSSYL